MLRPHHNLIHIMSAVTLIACGKKSDDNNANGPCGGPDSRGCLCSDGTQGTETCDPDTQAYGECMCTSMSVDTSCCIDGAFFDCPSVLTSDACFNNQEAGACTRDPSRDTMCQTGTSNVMNNGTNNTDEEGDPLCWANCRDGHELCADSCGGGEPCWDLCEDEDHAVCALRCGGGQICLDRCDASPTECAGRCS